MLTDILEDPCAASVVTGPDKATMDRVGKAKFCYMCRNHDSNEVTRASEESLSCCLDNHSGIAAMPGIMGPHTVSKMDLNGFALAWQVFSIGTLWYGVL